jgi:spore germination cell wall hydrolase CwlJ-like protein
MIPSDEAAIAKWTVALEAENQGTRGMLAVAYVIKNRAEGKWGSVLRACWSAKQFSCWNDLPAAGKRLGNMSPGVLADASRAVAVALSGSEPDPTKGATHYMNEELVIKTAGRLPSWRDAMQVTEKIGEHTFYKEA